MVTNLQRLLILLGLSLGFTPLALSQCEQIFTNPPSKNVNPGLSLSADLPPSAGRFTCDKKGCNRSNSFTNGDYNFSAGSFKQGSFISTNGATTRLYFDSLTLSQADINMNGRARDLIIYIRGDLSIAGKNNLNAIIYASGNVHFSGQASLSGALAAGGNLSISGQADVSIDLNEVQQANFNGMCQSQPAPKLHHFEFDYGDFPLTCKAETIAVRACANASCSQWVTDAVTANLSPNPVSNGGWYQGGNSVSSLSFYNGFASVDLRKHNTVSLTIGIASSNPTATDATLCRRGEGPLDTASCSLSFADSGLLFDIPDKLANRPENIEVLAVKKSDSTQTCVPAFVGNKTVNFWSSYLNPAVVINGQSLTINGTAISQTSSVKTPVTLNFDEEGSAAISVNYADAGKLQLDAQYVGSGIEQGLVMTGSDQFISSPVGLCIQPKDPAALCTAGDASCAAYKKAGDSFDLMIQGKAWQSDVDSDYCDNLNTPNYAQQDIALGHQLVAPAAKNLGSISNTLYNQVAATNNINTVSQSTSEVGVFKFTAKAPLGYLSANFYDIPMAESASIGRFVPASFGLSTPSVSAVCNSFTYMEQDFSVNYTLSAQNLVGTITQNYIGAFAKASVSLAAENANNGVDLSSRLVMDNVQNSDWVQGVAPIIGANATNFSRLSAPLVDGPFESLALGLKVQDNDGNHAKIASPDMNAANPQNPCTSCDAKTLGTTKIRHGRIAMENTYGPERETLNMPATAQYWNGLAWTTNLDDACTLVTAALDGREVYSPILVAGQAVKRTALVTKMNAGAMNLLWNNTGSVDYLGQVTAPLSVPSWLQWYWNWDGLSPNGLDDPRGSAFFGRYRGHDRIIFWRETQ